MKTEIKTHPLGIRLPLQSLAGARRAFTGILAATALFAAAVGSARSVRSAPANDDKIIVGQTAIVSGGEVSTWARVNGGHKVIWVGATIPLSMVTNMPPPGSGPAGAVVVLNFPPVVQATT